MKHNYDSLDLLKLILSLVVLVIHTFFMQDLFYPWARLTIPVYLILTGFFVFSKVDACQTEKEKKRAILQSVRRYLLLYALWLIIHLPVIDWTRFGYGRVSVRHFLFNLFQHFLLEETFRGSWYLMACILGVPIVYLLHTKMSKRAALYFGMTLYVMITLYALGRSAWPNWPLTTQMDQMVK